MGVANLYRRCRRRIPKEVHIPYFKIFYSTTFTALLIILVVLLLVTAADLIYRTYTDGRLYNIFIVGGVYVLTFLVIAFFYGFRLYTNRTVLASIPKSSIPIEKGDVRKSVRKIIEENLVRSAVIAYEACPRDLREEKIAAEKASAPTSRRNSIKDYQAISQVRGANKPTWGPISHSGWSSPSSPDLPNLQFHPVILELPHLIEAKAVSLAPVESQYQLEPKTPDAVQDEAPPPEAIIVEALQRPATIGLRDYFEQLIALGMITPPLLGSDFLTLYERARFTGVEVEEQDFRTLMGTFAEVLRGMRPLDAAIIAQLRAKAEDSLVSYSSWYEHPESDTDSEARSLESTNTVEHTPQPNTHAWASPSRSGSESEGTIRRPSISTSPRPPTTARRRSTRYFSVSNDLSVTSAQPTQKRFAKSPRKVQSTASSLSSRSMRGARAHASSTSTQRSGGSVIKIAEAKSPLDLPYSFVTSSREGVDDRGN